MYENRAVSFNWEKQFYSEFYNSTTKQNKLSWGFNAAFFLYNCFLSGSKKNCAVFKLIFTEKKLFNPAQVAFTKMQRNGATGKIYQETVFLCDTEGHLLTSSGCFLI